MDLLPDELPTKKIHSAVIHWNNLVIYTISFCLFVPSFPAFLKFLADDDQKQLTLPAWYPDYLYVVGTCMLCGSFLYDICARKDMDWSLLLHHVSGLVGTSLVVDSGLGTELMIITVLATIVEQPLDYSLYLYAVNSSKTLQWLRFGILSFMVTKILAQFAYYVIFVKQYSERNALYKVASPIVNAFLLFTQGYTAYVLVLIYQKRQRAAESKQQNDMRTPMDTQQPYVLQDCAAQKV